jgi:MFS family permease
MRTSALAEEDTLEAERHARRIVATLFAAMSLGSAASIAAATVNPLAGTALAGHASWAGVPSATILLGTALSSPLWGSLMDRIGRRRALVLGLLTGVAGSALSGASLAAQSLLGFLLGLALTGGASAGLTLSRFAAAEVHPPSGRARAIANVVLGGTVGAIVGPALVAPAGAMAVRLGVDELVGPFLVGIVLYLVSGLVAWIWLRPDPLDLGREIAIRFPQDEVMGGRRSLATLMRVPATQVAVSAMVLGQMVMVMLMVITSVHMRQHDHGLASISIVISAHTFGMFAFSVVSGRLADRWGRGPVILVGGALLVLAGLAAPLSPNVVPLAVSLFLLGLGWNLCYVGGSSLLADQLRPEERGRAQGFNDLLISLGSAVGSLGSGVVFASIGYGAMGIAGATLALVPMVMAFVHLRGLRPQPLPAVRG